MVSSSPPIRFKLLLFVVFVVLVAVVTFMVLYMLKPFETRKYAPPVPEKEAPVSEPAPVPSKTEPAKTKPEKTAASEKPVVEDEKPDASASGPKATVGEPVFQEKSGKWQITFKTDRELKCKHFTLKDPPRLAVDFLSATYAGKERLLDSPVPFITKIRVGEKPGYTRYVIDFSAAKVPKYEVANDKEGVIVTFTN